MAAGDDFGVVDGGYLDGDDVAAGTLLGDEDWLPVGVDLVEAPDDDELAVVVVLADGDEEALVGAEGEVDEFLVGGGEGGEALGAVVVPDADDGGRAGLA